MSEAKKQTKVSQNIELLWKARGIQAAERVPSLRDRIGKSPEEFDQAWETKSLSSPQCHLILEGSFFSFSNPALSPMLIKRGPTETRVNIVVMVFGTNPKTVAEISIIYDNNSPSFMKIMKIDPEVEIGTLANSSEARGLIVTFRGCAILFNADDPLESAVIR